MLCRNPYMPGETPFGCGQCLPCRINRRRQWTWRQYLESLMHQQNAFVTLTYAEEPAGGNLVKKDAQDWLHRLRKAVRPAKVRYFLVGEYGPQTLRPHYHATLFGLGVEHSAQIETSWGHGHVLTAEFNELTAQYISGYVVKKLTDSTDPRLSGRSPEFATMSRRPGIGSSAMRVIAEQLKTTHGRLLLQTESDVPKTLKLGRRSIPLGRYLIRRLREEVGMTEDDITAAKMVIGENQTAELRSLFEAEGATTHDQKKAAFIESIRQKILNTESRAAVFKKRSDL